MSDESPRGGATRLSDEELLAATPRGTGGKEAKVGALVLLGLMSLLVVLFWLTDPATLRGRYMIVTQVDDAGGVRVGDDVQMDGVNLGRVHRFEMVGAGEIYITMEIDRKWRVPVGSSAQMGESGIFGGRTLEIVRGTGQEFVEEWDTIPGVGASGSLLGSVDEISDRAVPVLESIDALLNDETIGSVRGSATELESLLTQLSAIAAEQRSALRDLTANLNTAAEGFGEASAAGPDIARAAARADSAMAMLTVTSENLDAATQSLRAVLDRMNRGEGTLGRLSTDESLYVNLNTAAESLNALLTDLQENPNKYINISIF